MYATSIVKEKKNIYIHRGKSLHNLLLKNVRYLFFACRGVYGVLIVMLMISSVVCFPPQNWTRSAKRPVRTLEENRGSNSTTRRRRDENIMIVRNTVEGM